MTLIANGIIERMEVRISMSRLRTVFGELVAASFFRVVSHAITSPMCLEPQKAHGVLVVKGKISSLIRFQPSITGSS